MKNTRSVAVAFVLALASASIGCAGAAEETSPADDAPVAQLQQAMVVPALSGVVGVVNVVGMIKTQVTYGRQISSGDIYGETLRLEADIDALRATTTTQLTNLLVQQKADQMAAFESTTTTMWNARRDLKPGKEAAFNTYVQNRDAMSFEALRQLNTTLIGDGLVSTGLFDAVAQSMRMTYSDGLPKDDKANTLGELALHMRLIQLEAFELLSQAWADSFFDIDAQRRELFANLDAQEARFFERMAEYNNWYVTASVRYWNDGAERAFAADIAWRRAEVLRSWNMVAAGGTQLDVTPRINVVNATFGNAEIPGSIAMLCNRQSACQASFDASRIGMKSWAPTQATLKVDYRCEGVPGVKSISVPEASGKRLFLSCNTADTVRGTLMTAAGDRRLILGVTNEGKTMWTSTVDGSFAGIGLCSADDTTGGLLCQSDLTATPASTWPVSVGRDATTGEPVLDWAGIRYTRTAR